MERDDGQPVIAAWLASAASAGVWVREPGAVWAQVAVAHQESGRVWLPGGARVDQTDEALLGTIAPLFEDGRFAATELSLYAEVGLGRGFEVYASLPLRTLQNRWALASSEYPDILQRNIGFGDLSVGGRFGRSFGALAASGYAGLRAPLYSNALTALRVEPGNSDFEDDRVPLGPGTLDLDVGGGVGYGLGRGWALAEAGLRVRSSQMSAAVPARVQLGVKPVPAVAAWVGLDALASLGNGAAPDFYRDEWGKGPVVVDNASALTLGGGAIVQLGAGWGVIGTLSHVVWGQRFPALTGGTLGLTWERPAPGGSGE